MLSRLDLELLEREAECWPDDDDPQWECDRCGHLNEHDGRVCERCEEVGR